MTISDTRGVTFELRETNEGKAFLESNPHFTTAFVELTNVSNQCFAHGKKPKDRQQDVCFSLAHACRQDLMEIVYLAVSGFGAGASKLLRGLYERAVTHAYIAENPEKAEAFVRYAGVQEYKLMVAGVRAVGEDRFNDAAKPKTSVAGIKEMYEKVKPEYQVTMCKNCGRTGTAHSWDKLDLVAMALQAGEEYVKYYLNAYASPNLYVHATAASAFKHIDTPEERNRVNKNEAEIALMMGSALLILVMKIQSKMYELNLDGQLEKCEADIMTVWGKEESKA
jgi:hypothetical protein